MKYSVIPSVITSRFWDGTKEIEQNGQKVKVTLSLQMPEGREEAIHRAIKDLMARTLTRREETKDRGFNQAVKDKLCTQLNEWLKDNRTDFSEEAFDTWHAGACKEVLDVLQDYYTNNDGSDVQYGKAQKIVNMTMKGLYCLKDAEKKNRYFEHCHIALDSFTLEWFKRAVIASNKDLSKGRVDSWSVFQNGNTNTYEVEKTQDETATSQVENKQEYYTYNYIIKLIRNYFKGENETNPYKGLTPFQAEFYIWPEIQLHLATEALFGQDIGKDAAIAYADEHYAVKPNGNEFGESTRSFSLYTDMFSKLPLEDKMRFLQERMAQMLQEVGNDCGTQESLEVLFGCENTEKLINDFSNCIAILIPLNDNVEAIKKYLNSYGKPNHVLESKDDPAYILAIYSNAESIEKKANNLVNYIKNKNLAEYVWCKDGKTCYKKAFGSDIPARRQAVRLEPCEDRLVLQIGLKE